MSLREQLRAIYDEHGRLTPDLVVQTARPKNHPLHPRVFDKPQREAAEAYYRDRAHELIQSVRIVYSEATDQEPDRSVRAFQAVRREDGQHVYEPSEKIAEDPFSRELVLRDMERDWTALRRRYEAFVEFVTMIRRDLEDGEAA